MNVKSNEGVCRGGVHSLSEKWFSAFYGRPEISHGLQKAIQVYLKGNVEKNCLLNS